ncbi:MAG: prepilin-type N-terminal cleavage/methylation domain-containing protein, partial [Gibbsiella quercinecans]|uniref:prepilin-type N-terminal cleavage/methylation domain-containing protein n=1 Tax=Gibbsiella quercinecans TaxID=929813 RepID=UPI003F2E54B7
MKMKRMESRRRQRGFTLLELLAVMALVAILTGWGVGQWHRQQQVLRLEHTAQQLLAFLTRVQADANWRNRAALLWFRQGDP